LPELTDNQTFIALVVVIGCFVTAMVYIASNRIGGAIHRLAEVQENTNHTRAKDLEQVRGEIRSETHAIVDSLGRDFDRHVEETSGVVHGLNTDVDRIDDNLGRVAGVVAEVADTARMEIAGSTWWGADDVPLQTRFAGRDVAVQVANDPSADNFYRDTTTAHAAPGHTGVMPAHSGHTGVIPARVTTRPPIPGQEYSQPPFDPQDPQSIFDAFMGDLRELDPQAMPWDIHPQYANSTPQHTHFAVFRAKVQKRYGIMLRGEHETFGGLPAYQALTRLPRS